MITAFGNSGVHLVCRDTWVAALTHDRLESSGLALLYLFAGGIKPVRSKGQLRPMMEWAQLEELFRDCLDVPEVSLPPDKAISGYLPHARRGPDVNHDPKQQHLSEKKMVENGST
jgi:hypothetical protein